MFFGHFGVFGGQNPNFFTMTLQFPTGFTLYVLKGVLWRYFWHYYFVEPEVRIGSFWPFSFFCTVFGGFWAIKNAFFYEKIIFWFSTLRLVQAIILTQFATP